MQTRVVGSLPRRYFVRTLAIFLGLVAALTLGLPAIGQLPGSLQVIDLDSHTDPKTLDQAHAGLAAGTAILRVSDGIEGEIERLIGVPLVSATVRSATAHRTLNGTEFEKLPSSPMRAAAAYKDEHGVIRSAIVFADGAAPSDREGWRASLDRWVASEQARASSAATNGNDPEPPADAWTAIYRSTLITHSSNNNASQLTIAVFRLDSISAASDYYMVATVPETVPDYHDCNILHCDWHMLSQDLSVGSLRLIPDADGILIDHGPTTTVDSHETGFDVGGDLTKDGPGLNVGFSETWSTVDVNTKDNSDHSKADWQQEVTFPFPSQPCKPVGGPPGASKGTYLSRQAAIFQVPANTTGISVPIQFNSTFCSYDFRNSEPLPSYDQLAIAVDLQLGAPILQPYPLKITIPAGQTRAVLVSAYIPGSDQGFSWTSKSNQLWATVDSEGPFSTGRVLPITIAPNTANGLQAVISINTDPSYAAPAVRSGPVEVQVTVGAAEPVASGGILLAGGINPGGLLQHNSQVFDYNNNILYTTGPPSVPRLEHTATLLKDGRILFAGGATSIEAGERPVTASAEIYTPATLQYSNTGNLHTARRSHAAIRLPDGKVLLTGGFDAKGEPLNTAELYDPVAGNFTLLPHTMVARRAFHYANLLPNTGSSAKVILYGGMGDDGDTGATKPLKSAEIWDESTGVFTSTSDLPFALEVFPSPVFRQPGELVTAGGLLDGDVSGKEFHLDLANPPSFAADAATLNHARFNHTLTALADNAGLLVTGGSLDVRNSTYTSEAELRDNSGWTVLPSKMTVPRLDHTATLLPDGRVFIAGGFPESSSITTEFYNPSTKAFAAGPTMIGRYAHTATLFSSSTTALAVSPSASVLGQSVSLSAQVSTALGASSGAVTFLDGSAALGTVPLSKGQASFVDRAFTIGTHVLTAVYSGDEVTAQSTSDPATLVVSADASSLSISSSPNPSQLAQPVVVSVTVQPQSGSGAAPTGTVTLTDGSASLGTITLASGKGSLTTTSLSLGSHTITATYSGDSAYKPSSGIIQQAVTKQATVTTLAAMPSAPVFGQTVTFTSSVTLDTKQLRASSGLSGTVEYKDGDSVLGQAPLTSNSAQFTTSTLDAGKHSITATYSGDGEAAGSTSPARTVTVAPASTSVALLSSANPSNLGEPVVFTATVSSMAANVTGTVTFYDGASPLGPAVPLANGTAAVSISSLTTGNHSITARYSGDAQHAANTSAVLTQTVKLVKVSTATTVSGSPNPSLVGESVKFQVVVVPASGKAEPMGQVTLKDGDATLATLTLAEGSASFSTATLGAGQHSITAVYAGDSAFDGSSSAPLQQTVRDKLTPTVMLQSDLNPSTVGAPVTFTATVSSAGNPTPTGSITISEDLDGKSVIYGTAPLIDGIGKVTTDKLTLGTHAIRATYGGDGSIYNGAASPPVYQVVVAAP